MPARSEVAAVLDEMLRGRMQQSAAAAGKGNPPRSGLEAWERENRTGPAAGSFAEGSFAYTTDDRRVSLAIGESCTDIGSRLWDSCLLTCKMAEHSIDSLVPQRQDRSVVELGAGCGLLGILLSKLGVAEVVCTDLPAVVPHLEKNVAANGASAGVACGVLQWGDPDSAAELCASLRHPVVLLAAVDVCMRAVTVAPLLATVRDVMRAQEDPAACRCLVTSPTQREGWPVLLQQAVLPEYGFVVTPVPPSLLHPEYRSRKISSVFLTLRGVRC